MHKILEDYFLAKIDWYDILLELANKYENITLDQSLSVCEVLKKFKTAECNVSEAEERLREIFQ